MQWISTKVAVPRAGLDVIACYLDGPHKASAFAHFDGTKWVALDGQVLSGAVTHWLLLEWPKD